MEKCLVGFKSVEGHGVVNMADGDAIFFQPFSPQHIFIAIAPESFVKGVLQEQGTTHQEVRRVEILFGLFQSLFQRMIRFVGFLVAKAQVATQVFGIAFHYIASINGVALCLQVVKNEVGTHDAHAAVNKKQPLVACFLGQKVTNGSSPHIVFPSYVAAIRHAIDSPIGLNDILIGRSIIGHNDFEA